MPFPSPGLHNEVKVALFSSPQKNLLGFNTTITALLLSLIMHILPRLWSTISINFRSGMTIAAVLYVALFIETHSFQNSMLHMTGSWVSGELRLWQKTRIEEVFYKKLLLTSQSNKMGDYWKWAPRCYTKCAHLWRVSIKNMNMNLCWAYWWSGQQGWCYCVSII